MSTPFPFMHRGNFATYKGNFYVNRGDHWRKIECYLPAATGTYSEPLEATAERFLAELVGGKLYAIALTDAGRINATKYHLDGEKFRASPVVF